MSRLVYSIIALVSLMIGSHAWASDHADPMELLLRQPQEGAITDLFVFPVLADESPAFPYDRNAGLPLHDTLADIVRQPLDDDQQKQIDSLVFILCVRRQLTDSTKLKLEPYTYRIKVDLDSTVEFPTQKDLESDREKRLMRPMIPDGHHHHNDDAADLGVVEAFARYGGKISEPTTIHEDLTIEFRLDNQAVLKSVNFDGVGSAAVKAAWKKKDKRLVATSGVFDDPFIFPGFFGTNVVGIAIRIPLDLFPREKLDLLIWATSHKGGTRIDHVGRSLRTQNPRFDCLNTLEPSEHVAALLQERKHPSLMRDIALQFNVTSYFAFREWDFVPDVMCYSTRYPVGFPNGRLLTDDVAAILAQHGDTLLYELSFQDRKGGWPRTSTNDRSADPNTPGAFEPTFPYLLAPHPDSAQPGPRHLTWANFLKIIGIVVLFIAILIFTHWAFARWYHRRKLRRRYL
ncbi:hypothetical protein [Rhodopirellula sp. MGV]|uniref:hypothetical protein n=1 Tax=Rhodopirellula sp. MGV TaxID=2023130 RepID=UPI000B96FF99|nr:hypothetical protein [Rhodopirellula sp. MGV]OYP38155.1 hypothetical protein CGZ80_02695 [Rhodopirellula sp. MGV]PNY38495.1 hypothetical protein C2E31_00755 [Rhodopirellula baltica]